MNVNHILKVYLRNFRKELYQHIIKIIGLTAGLTCALLVFLFLQDELKYDSQYPKHDRIYRYGAGMSIGGPQTTQSTVNPAAGPVLMRYIPEIENFFRYRPMGEVLIRYEENEFFERSMAYADSSILNILSIPLIVGVQPESLAEPFSIVIDQTLANRIFGDSNPVGKVIDIDGQGSFTVTGVMKDMPDNTHLNSSAFISFHTQFVGEEEIQSPTRFFGNMDSNLFILAYPGTEKSDIEKKLESFYDNHLKDIDPINYVSIIEPLKDLRLKSIISQEYSRRNKGYFFSFLSIGLITLLLSIINYFNISTSNSINRSKEISLRKVNGSKDSQLIFQFNLESFITVLFSYILSIIIAYLVLEYSGINNILNKNLEISLFSNSGLLIYTVTSLIIIGLLAGWYPSIILTRTRPIEFLKGKYSRSAKGRKLRSVLVGFQFVMSISAIVIILLMDSQLKYMINSDLGFKSENFMIIQARNDELIKSMESFRDEMLRYPGIESATFARSFPGAGISGIAFKWQTEEGDMKMHAFPVMLADKYFQSSLGLEIIEGENFENFSENDSVRYFLVNESLVVEMGWTNPVGKKNELGTVVGVVKDFKFNSLHNESGAAFICLYPVPRNNLGIRIKKGSEKATLEFVKDKWADISGGAPLSYSFLEDIIADRYTSDRDQQSLLAFLALITVLISGLGLLGITSQSMLHKTKEVTIRKVFGAEKYQVTLVLFKDVLYLIGVAIILSTPLSLWLYNKWVQNFAFHVDMKIINFLIADLAILTFAIALSSYHGSRVMNTKPIDKLRYE